MANKKADAQNTGDDYQMKEGQFMVFKNQRKEKESQPDLWGKCMVNGNELRVSLWKAQSTNGNTYWNGQINDYKPAGAKDDMDV